MKYTKYDLGGYDLHIINTNRFKTISIKVVFKEKLCKENLMKMVFLSELLLYTSNNYRTERDLEIAFQDLYNIKISLNTTKSGFYQIFSATESFINEKYTEDGMNQNSIEFLKEILFNPFTDNESFEQEKFDRVKRLLIENLENIKENPSGYSLIKMREAVGEELYSLHPFLLIDMINDITPSNLYDYYLDMLRNDKVDIIIIGDVDDSIKEAFTDLNLKNEIKCTNSHIVDQNNIKDEPQYVEETFNSNQSKLAVAFKLIDLTDFERRYVLNLYSFILGGSGDSKLFKNLREKHSLCYYVSSDYNNLYNVLEIIAGINSKNIDLALKLINEEIKNIEDGNIENDELEKGKNTYISACKEINDKQISIINDYLSHEYFNNDLVEDKIKNISKVTKEDIINLSKKIHIDTIYLLKGATENDKK